MKKLLGTAAILAIAMPFAANAADLPPAAPSYKAPVVAPVPYFSWTGFYIGVHGGGDWFNKDWAVPLTATNIAGGCPGCPTLAGGHTASGWLAGGQVGFNYQFGMFVVGAEAQGSWTRLEGSNVNSFAPFITDHSKTDGLATFAGRVGAAFGPALVFVKGGGAWAHDTFWTSTAVIPVAQSLTDDRWGWMIGGGVEYAFWHNWSVKVEYDHLDFGTRRETLAAVAPGVLPFEYDVKQTIDLVKVGVNYRFGFDGPVVARY
jgi:outer membrane immunogenic protein